MTDARTIAFYDGAAAAYDDFVARETPDADLTTFMTLLPEGARVLDLGCGPARASAHMRAAGFLPDPVDASEGMVALANETHAIGARVMTFDDLDVAAAYDAVWANFSLLHAPRADLPRHLAAIARALRPGGVLHIGMKTGAGDLRDRIDRFYTLVSVEELHSLLRDAGFTILSHREGAERGCAGTMDPYVIVLSRCDG